MNFSRTFNSVFSSSGRSLILKTFQPGPATSLAYWSNS
jgi:hypothetical protein